MRPSRRISGLLHLRTSTASFGITELLCGGGGEPVLSYHFNAEVETELQELGLDAGVTGCCQPIRNVSTHGPGKSPSIFSPATSTQACKASGPARWSGGRTAKTTE